MTDGNWPDDPNDIPLMKEIGWATEYAIYRGLEGEGIYCFVLGKAITYLQRDGTQRVGLKSSLACSVAIEAVSRYRDEHEECFMVLPGVKWWQKGEKV